MKKKIILISLIAIVLIAGLFVLTGCGNKNNENTTSNIKNSSTEKNDVAYVEIDNDKYKLQSKSELNELHYLENYVDFNTDRVGNTKMMSFNYEGNFSFEVRINCEEEHSYDEVKATLSKYEEKTKEVNGITYTYYEYKNNLGDTAHYYLYEYNNKTYSIIFFLGENPGNIEEVFMNNVRFE